jgi:hypothetical protein
MDSELIERISEPHRERLAWFEKHQGEVSPFPGPLPPKKKKEGLLLVSRQRGIYKPGNLAYALSIRINLRQTLRRRRTGPDARRRLAAVVSPR